MFIFRRLLLWNDLKLVSQMDSFCPITSLFLYVTKVCPSPTVHTFITLRYPIDSKGRKAAAIRADLQVTAGGSPLSVLRNAFAILALCTLFTLSSPPVHGAVSSSPSLFAPFLSLNAAARVCERAVVVACPHNFFSAVTSQCFFLTHPVLNDFCWSILLKQNPGYPI